MIEKLVATDGGGREVDFLSDDETRAVLVKAYASCLTRSTAWRLVAQVGRGMMMSSSEEEDGEFGTGRSSSTLSCQVRD